MPGGVQPDLKTPTLISWSFRIQQELTANTALTVGYVGSHGYHELIGIDANEPFPVICPAAPCPATYPEQLSRRHRRHAGSRGNLLCSDRDQGQSRARQHLDLFFGRRQFLQRAAGGREPPLQQRASRCAASTPGRRRIDDGDSLNATTSGGEPALASNPFNLRADRGLANFDVRNVGVINASYALPFGPEAFRTLHRRGWRAAGRSIRS